MKAVMLSIKPKYCELIASGKKTIEVRKTRPKLETPFKCYIYCTKPKNNAEVLWTGANCVIGKMSDQSNGKAIGKFVCDKIDKIHIPTELIYEKEVTGFNERTLNILNQSCLSYDEIVNYSGCTLNNYDPRKDWLFAWHISGLVIYDKPKELSEFYKHDNTYDNAFGWVFEDRPKKVPIKRPPQSWCYVEEV